MEDEFPGSEDYGQGCDPVRDLTLLEQIKYWKARARAAELLAHQRGELTHAEDDADYWKRG
ncbi:MAG: hypothetical protein LC734_04815 [Acidobacteria bacterium]|nr:hypothetical protein [Acidobacteriota bacterium]